MTYRVPCFVVALSSLAIALCGCPPTASAPGAGGAPPAAVTTSGGASPSSSTSASPATASTEGGASRAPIVTVSGAPPSRAVLLGVARALTRGQLDLANEVAPRLRRSEARELAGEILAEQRLALGQVTAVQTRLGGVAAEGGELRQGVVGEVNDVLSVLARTEDAELDAAYIDAQVALHGRAVELLDELDPAPSDAQLRALLASLRTTFATRLATLQKLDGARSGP